MIRKIAFIRGCSHDFVTFYETKYWKYVGCKYCIETKYKIKNLKIEL